jgi:hypothetical protein
MSQEGEERKIANLVRQWFGVDADVWIDIVECITRGKVWTVHGEKRLVLEIVCEHDRHTSEMLNVDALTLSNRESVIIKIMERVYRDAVAGARRARMTLAHELGHAVLCHPREALARLTGANRMTLTSPSVRKFEAEASRFAFCFLVKDELAQSCLSAADLADRFEVSVSSAEIWFLERRRAEEQPRVSGGFEALLRHLNNSVISTGVSFAQPRNPVRSEPDPELNGHPCTCTKGHLRPFGGKYRCDSCGRIVELPDGDSCGSPAVS